MLTLSNKSTYKYVNYQFLGLTTSYIMIYFINYFLLESNQILIHRLVVFIIKVFFFKKHIL